MVSIITRHRTTETHHNLNLWWPSSATYHYNDGIMSAIVSQITSISIVCSTICSGAVQRKHQSSASLAFVCVCVCECVCVCGGGGGGGGGEIHRRPMESPHKGPVTQKMIYPVLWLWGGQRNYIYIDSLVQDCSVFGALAMGFLQPCTKPSIWDYICLLHPPNMQIVQFLSSLRNSTQCCRRHEI